VRHYCVVNDAASLVWVANLSTIELHPFLARADRPDEPTAVMFDLDPGSGAGLLGACAAGLRLRALLAEQGLVALAKTSGGSGLHVSVPLNRPHRYAETKAFAREVAARLSAEAPDRVTDNARRSARAGRVLVDWLQNEPRRSTVAPYSLRAADWPVVSTPVTWEEVERAVREERPERLVFTPGEVLRRVEEMGDVFAGVLTVEQRLG
jgi:bifunctional non-homologous end joining protein LigD